MAIETELKLRITPERLARLRRHALFRNHQITAPVTHRLHNIYYDTLKLELHQRKMALRLRRVKGYWLQTLKGGGRVLAGLHQRFEWEVPVPSEKLDFSNLDASVWDEHLPPAIREKLRPVFITDFYRSNRQLNWQGAIIEVCMDHGEVSTDQHSTPICEVELELKSGEPRQLFELAQALLEIVSFELETVSKAEHGFRLLAGYIAQPVKAELPRLAKTDSLTDGLQALIWSCLLHLQGNLHGAMESGATENHDAEYLHQMRIALRRLRVVLRMAEKIHADEALAALREKLARLGVELGRIREWDVFIAQTLQPMCAAIEGLVGQQSMQALLEYSQLQRADCYAALRGTVQARELQRLLLCSAIWMNGSYWRQAEQGAPQACDFAAKRLHQLYKRYARAGEELLDAPHFHALRIHAKKLRYSAEFFSALYDKHKARLYLAALSDVQESLGGINDIAVARRLLDEMPAYLSEHAEVIVFIKGRLDADLSLKLKMLHKLIQHFNKQHVFWEKG
jgi:triphosphatase